MATKKAARLNPARRVELPKPLGLEEWAKDEVRRARLTEILTDPVLQEALSTLESSYSPSVPSFIASESSTTTPSSVDLNNLLALRHVHRAGFFGFPTALRNLTRERVLKRAERAPWGDLIPD
jgi:hypothetical protein